MNDNLPCYQCPVLPICKSHKDIDCYSIDRICTGDNTDDILNELYKMFPKAKCFSLNPDAGDRTRIVDMTRLIVEAEGKND